MSITTTLSQYIILENAEQIVQQAAERAFDYFGLKPISIRLIGQPVKYTPITVGGQFFSQTRYSGGMIPAKIDLQLGQSARVDHLKHTTYHEIFHYYQWSIGLSYDEDNADKFAINALKWLE